MNIVLVLLAALGCCLAQPNRQDKSYGSQGYKQADQGYQQSGYAPNNQGYQQIGVVPNYQGQQQIAALPDYQGHQQIAVVPNYPGQHHIAPNQGYQQSAAVPATRYRRNVEAVEVPSYPEFGAKTVPTARVTRKVVPSRARAVDGRSYESHHFNYVQPEVRYDQVVPKALSHYTHKPLYQPRRDYNQYQGYKPSYQQFSNQYKTDDVAQPLPLPVAAPGDAAEPPRPIAILAQNQDVNYDGTFVYDFEAENGIKSAVSGSTKRVEGLEKPVQVMSGSYSYTSPDGSPVETRWFADETGFHAEGDHLPVAPPVPEPIQRALEYIKAHPQEDEMVDSNHRRSEYPSRQNYYTPHSYPAQQQNYNTPQSYPAQQQNYNTPQSYPAQQQNYPYQQHGHDPSKYPAQHHDHNYQKYPAQQQNDYPHNENYDQTPSYPSQSNNPTRPF